MVRKRARAVGAWRGLLGCAALAATLAVVGCKPKVKPGLTVAIQTVGGTEPGDRVRAIRLVFDRPMVTDAQIGPPVAQPPFALEPRAPGVTRWVDARTLVFSAESSLPRSTKFTVRVPEGTVALDGTGLPDGHSHSFETERLVVAVSLPQDGPADVRRWAPPDQAVLLAFNQPVAPKALLEHCGYHAGETRTAPTITTETERETDTSAPKGTRFRVRPAEPLTRATTYEFRCAPALTGAEGTLPMAPLAEGGKRERAQVTFSTFGPFKVLGIQPSGKDVDPDQSSIVVKFSTPPVRPNDDGRAAISVEPAIEGFPRWVYATDDELHFDVQTLPPNTRYKVTIAAGLQDRLGQTLEAPFEGTFQTGNAKPRLDLETGLWVVEAARGAYVGWARNVTKLDVEATAVPEARLPELLRALDWWDEGSVDLAKMKLAPRKQTLPVAGKLNEWGQVAFSPKELLGAGTPATGFFYFAVRAPEVPRERSGDEEGTTPQSPPAREVLLNLTDLGVTAKLASGSGLVWVTRLSDGQPQPNAEIVVRDRKGKVRWRGRTGTDGVAELPGRAQLLPEAVRGSSGDGEEDEFEGGSERPKLLVFARVGADLTFVDPDRYGGFEAWSFNVTADEGGGAERLRGFAHTDRGLYRPGDTVHVRGLVRTMHLGRGLLPPPTGRKVDFVVRNPRGEPILERKLALSRFGSFSLDVPLPLDARLGDYTAEARLPGGSFRERFQVEEYRPATFEAKLKAAAERFYVGDRLRVSAEGRYLYGAPLRGGKIKWRLASRVREPAFAGLEGFTFGDDRRYDRWNVHGAQEVVGEEVGELDGTGRDTLALRLKAESFRETRDLIVSAELSDETNQTIAANLVVPVHHTRVYFGLRAPSPVVAAEKEATVELVAVDPTGRRVTSEPRVTVVRREWSCAWEQFGYRGSYRCDQKDTEIVAKTVAIAADAPATVRFVPPASGTYLVVASGKDERGRSSEAATTLWAYGAGEPPWEVNDSNRFTIVADKARYQAGDTARLLLKTSTQGAQALITIEREGLLERRLASLDGAQTIDVPVRAEHGPNVYVSVMLVRGRTAKGPRGLPHVHMGLVELPVETQGKHLTVSVTTDRESYRPGESVTASVRVTDEAGKPVAGEVALAAADEGVLSLIAFKTPDPISTFYAPWGWGVRTTTQYDRLARLPEPEEQRDATGGDGPGRLGTLRSRFLATAYWNPSLETDADGRAQVTFPAPDNLTAFRLMAVAADAGDRFGSGDRRFRVAKPFQMMAVAPRFLTVGDEARIGVVLHNETQAAGTATVALETNDAVKLSGPATKTVDLAPGARAPVTFPLRATRPGPISLRFSGTLGEEKDGLALEVPGTFPTAAEAALVAAGESTDKVEVPIALPEGVVRGSATLEVSVDPDGLAGIEEGLRELIEYPYGCLEQTTSRLIPLVAVEELARGLGLAELDGPKLQRYIRVAVEKIGTFQAENGGFGLWRGSPAEPYLTAFALWGLKLAADAGHTVDPKRLEDGVAYLKRSVANETPRSAGVHDELGEQGSRAFALYVLGLFGKSEPGIATKMLEAKASLPRFGLAFLAQALAGPLGPTHPRVAGLLDELLGAADRKPAQALVREKPDQRLGFFMSSDVRTSAIATDAFVSLRPADPALPDLVRGLLAERKRGVWMTTQENLFALVALTRYIKTRPAAPSVVEVRLGAKRLMAETLPTTGAARVRRVTVPVVGTATERMLITVTQGRAFYQARLRFRRDVDHQPAISEGLTLRRELIDAETGAPIVAVPAGKMVRVRLTVGTREERHRVAIVDRLPAGLEAVNTRFATTAAARPAPAGDEQSSYWLRHRELRDDRVEVFADWLWPGDTTFEYLARATTAGKYVLPGATAEEMYAPEVRARTPLGAFEVLER